MNVMIKPAPIRRSLTVPATPDKAFEVFTAGFSKWWPPSHKIGASPYKASVIEPRKGGRWYEIGEDGSECQWGEVLAWDPPKRLVLAWRITTDWRFDPHLLTEVEVNFLPAEPGHTRVELEHRLLENMGPAGEQARAIFESEGGWPGILRRFEQAIST